jgi:malate dehydrogenase
MSVSIAIVGASGSIGTALAANLLRSRLLEPEDRVQLVGHGNPKSEARLLATRIDLLDAFDDSRIEIEVVAEIADLDADIVVVTAGISLSQAGTTNRRDMGAMNLALFQEIARQCATHVPDALFIVVSNPVELAVQALCEKLDRKRVVGMGAQQDSLRFARAIAKDLGVSRHQVRATVLGEHGLRMVPIWSSVELTTRQQEMDAALGALRRKSEESDLRERVASLQQSVIALLKEEKVTDAYEAARQALPDARIFIEPSISVHCMHSTPNATANATLQVIAAALADDHRRIHGQVMLDGECFGIHGVFGIPISLDRRGWIQRPMDVVSISPLESAMIEDSANSIRTFLDEVTSIAPPAVNSSAEARPAALR